MKALVQERFGPPDSLRLADVDMPRPGPGQVLVRVRAAALNPYDWHMLRGDPFVARLFGTGLLRPKHPVCGIDGAEVVEEVGAGVTTVSEGDAVLGFCPGSFAEFSCTAAELVVLKPDGVSFEQAAALPMAGTTALRGLRVTGELAAGQRLLVNGAAGGVGTFAVQFGAALGAEVTAVCSGRNAGLVRELGASHVVDYMAADFSRTEAGFDVVLDNQANRPLRAVLAVLRRDGILVQNGGGSPGKALGALGNRLGGALIGVVVPQRIRSLPTVMEEGELQDVADAVASGTVRPVVDRVLELADVPAGLTHLERGHARGKTVVAISGGSGTARSRTAR